MYDVARITDMEALLDESQAALEKLMDALEGYAAVQENVRTLDAYYTSDEWREDFEADERGLLPAGLKRGVLSEDAVYDLLTDNREILARLLEVAAESLREG